MKKLGSWLVIVMLMTGFYYMFPEFCQKVYEIIQYGDISSLAEYIQSFGIWGAAITLLLFVILTFTLVFPFMILSGAVGIVYGIFWGVVLSWLGEICGAVAMFIFARYFFRGLVEKWVTKSRYLKQVDDYSAENGFKALLFARLLPLAPSAIITAVAAISKISVRDFLLASVIGKLPPVIIKVLLGHDLAFAGENMTRLIIVIGLVAAIYAIMWVRKRNQHQVEA